MTDTDWLDQLEQKAAAATAGPWRASILPGFGRAAEVRTSDGRYIAETGTVGLNGAERDAEFIAAANPHTVQTLINEHRALAAKVARVEALANGWAVMAGKAMDADTREWLVAASRSVHAALSDGSDQ